MRPVLQRFWSFLSFQVENCILVMDQKRSNIGQFYSPEAILVYEGHRIKGQSQISDFYQKNPPSSHRVTSLDSQPIDKSMTEGAKSILINGSFHFSSYIL